MEEFIEPVSSSGIRTHFIKGGLINPASVYFENQAFPDLEALDLAIIGVPEDRGSIGNSGSANAPDAVRKKLFGLGCGDFVPRIADLGNIRKGQTLADTYAALQVVCAELLTAGIIPIIIGGSQDITFAQYLSYKKFKKTVNIVSVDSAFDLGNPNEKKINAGNFVGKIILHQPNFLFHLSNVGFQTHFVGRESIQLMERLFFDAYRLGFVRKNLEEVEPVLRNADILTFDIGSIRASDAPGHKHGSPNGLFGEEACQIARYAGLNEKLTSVGFYETNPDCDRLHQTSFLTAQLIWYFVDGYYHRKLDDIQNHRNGFKKFRVVMKDAEKELVFLKSKKSDRWWLEVPGKDPQSEGKSPYLIPCSYNDYETACRNEIPERWWLAVQKSEK